MDKKGFTLVELLAVIIVLSLVAVIAILSVSNTLKKSKNRLREVQINTIIEQAKKYVNETPEAFDKFIEGSICVDVSTLIENDYFENDRIEDPLTKENFDGSVTVEKIGKQYYYTYEDYRC